MKARFCIRSKWSAFVCRSACIASFCLSLQPAFAATLAHRYSFATDASDSVGGANGTLAGAAFITNGAVVLDGSNSLVQLPNDLLTNYTSVSFEVWFADASINTTNAQLYTFAGTNGSLFYQLDGDGGFATNGVAQVVGLPSPAVGGTNHLIWTLDATNQTGALWAQPITNETAALYVNGLLAAQNTQFTLTPAQIGSTTNDCIGGSGGTNTALDFHGRIFEFRVYDGVLTPLEAAVLDAFGPDQPQTNPGTLQAVRLLVPTPTGPGALFRAGVFADFSGITNVNISTQPDLVLSSDNTNVIAIAPDGRLRTVALGTADVTVSWEGFSNTEPVTVAMPQDVALLHRYSFSEQTNDWIVHDSVGDANGRLFNATNTVPPYSLPAAAFTGNGELKMTGYPDSRGAYVALPPGLISDLSEVSIEAWVTWTPGIVSLTYEAGSWQRIFDFGSSYYTYRNGVTQTRGMSYLFLTPAGNNYSITSQPLHTTISTDDNNPAYETPELYWTNYLPTNVMSQVAVTYSPVRHVMKMYLNGVPVADGYATIPLSSIVDTNDWLGRSQFSLDPYFNGSYNEFRIYRGLLSDADIAADYAAGPDVVGEDYVLHAFPSSNSLAITWGRSATNLVLKTSPVLGAGATWSQVPVQPVLFNGRFRVTVPFTNNAAFYRLLPP